MTDLLHIDGSHGEGGGQIVRSSLTLSVATGRPIRITRLRAGRKKPGLLRQHLTAVRAATAVGAAEVTGGELGSTELTFRPTGIVPGEHRFAVGTAGSATLVLQTVLPVLLTAKQPSRLTLEGGTHNPFAPPFEFLDRAFLPQINRMGPTVTATLEQSGFFPAGGGRFVVDVEPCAGLTGLQLLERGEPGAHHATALLSNLPENIADRELGVVARRLGWGPERLHTSIRPGPGPGNALLIQLEHEHATEVFTGFGEPRRRATAVADLALKLAQEHLACDAPVGPFLADQLLLPAALAAAGGEPSAYRITRATRHLTTHLELVKLFVPVEAELEGDVVRVRPG